MWWLWFRRRRSFGPPAPDCDGGPDGLYESKRPSSLKETVSRSQDARTSERQDVPMAPLFKCIEDQHRRYCNQSKDSQSIHFRNVRFSRAVWNSLSVFFVDWIEARVREPLGTSNARVPPRHLLCVALDTSALFVGFGTGANLPIHLGCFCAHLLLLPERTRKRTRWDVPRDGCARLRTRSRA